MGTTITPGCVFHRRRSYQNHRINWRGDATLCGKPIDSGEVVAEDDWRPMCRQCDRAWPRETKLRLLVAGCKYQQPELAWRGTATDDVVTCTTCGALHRIAR